MKIQHGAFSGEGNSFASSLRALHSVVDSARPSCQGSRASFLPSANSSPLILAERSEYHGQHFSGSAAGSVTSSVWVTTCLATLKILTAGYELKL